MRDITFGTGEYYHVYVRGVDKRNMFMDDVDRRRFLATMQKANIIDDQCRVAIISFVLMSNHIHLLLRHERSDGVPAFMQRLHNSYAKYFNKRHDREGHLCSSKYKAKHIDSDAYFLHLTRYIHKNPLSLRGVTSRTLEEYRWSSYRHYLGFERQPFVDAEAVLGDFKEQGSYRAFMNIRLHNDVIEPYLFNEE